LQCGQLIRKSSDFGYATVLFAPNSKLALLAGGVANEWYKYTAIFGRALTDKLTAEVWAGASG
jgi:hypothetical protein